MRTYVNFKLKVTLSFFRTCIQVNEEELSSRLGLRLCNNYAMTAGTELYALLQNFI